MAKTQRLSAISTMVMPPIRATGTLPPPSGTQVSVPAIFPGVPPTLIGTRQSKMCVRLLLSLS
jgi:hypothetical protein